MTDQPYSQPPTITDYSTQPPAPGPSKPRTKLALILFIAAAVMLVATAGIAYVAIAGVPGGGLSKESAERACRTAFGDEWRKRSNTVGGGDTSIIASVKSVEMLETVKENGGYTVNGTVHYTLTTALVAPVEGSIDLTCKATGSDDAPTTTVDNR
jgi:hypothetical protein